MLNAGKAVLLMIKLCVLICTVIHTTEPASQCSTSTPLLSSCLMAFFPSSVCVCVCVCVCVRACVRACVHVCALMLGYDNEICSWMVIFKPLNGDWWICIRFRPMLSFSKYSKCFPLDCLSNFNTVMTSWIVVLDLCLWEYFLWKSA